MSVDGQRKATNAGRRVPAVAESAGSGSSTEAAFWSSGVSLSPAGFLAHRRPFDVGPFRITPYHNDHSAFDAYSLLVEADGRRLFYSGDIRGHGRKAGIFDELLRKPPRAVDVLLMEGTNVRPDTGAGTPDEPTLTEADVETPASPPSRPPPGWCWPSGRPRTSTGSSGGRPAEDVRRVFARVLRHCLGPNPGGAVRRSRVDVPVVAGTGVWPNAADRPAPARRLLGVPATLWAQPSLTPARVPERPASAHVYLDVSGSMSELLPRLVGLLVPFVADGRAAAWQFSTTVEPLPLAALHRGRLTTTFGTSIDCVAAHLLAHPAVRRAVIVTDGYVGRARADLARRLADTGVRLHGVLPAESAWAADLEALGAAVTVLPPMRPSTPTGTGRRR